MSLKREQWEVMWQDIRLLESDHVTNCDEIDPKFCRRCRAIIRIKDRIEQVIGQMRREGEL